MADQPVEAPTNSLLNVIHKVTDTLISGAGVEVAIAAGLAQFPALGLPGVKSFYRFAVTALADQLNTSLKQRIDVVVIRYQGDSLKKSYDAEINHLKDILAEKNDELTLSKEQLADLRTRVDSIISRTR